MLRSLRPLITLWVVSAALPAVGASGFAGEVLAVGAGARGLALGNAYVTTARDATAGYWNPAGLSGAVREVHLMHAERYAGLVDQDFVAATFDAPYTDGAAISLLRLGVEDIAFTTLPNPAAPLGPDNRPLVSSTETSADYALYLSGGRQVSDRLALGLSAKVIYRSVADFSAYGGGLDVGIRYRLSEDFVLAGTLRDVTTTPIVWDGGTDRIQPSVLFGVGYTRSVGPGVASLLLSSRGGGDASDQSNAPINAGVEYQHGNLSLRAGLDEERQSFGLGLQPHARLGLDIAYLQHPDLEETYLLSARIGF
ncbi:MAG: hypothetical protein VYC64_18405 [Candidatus Latescibacterota bacterium]|nr:hypothetical protein [Candidatus Latescibacterota bacterium]